MTATVAPENGALDSEQRAVADAPVAARMVVTAGPGAGKTKTLLARVAKLIDDGLQPGGELLVLSFSRAAVETVRGRGREAGELGRIPVMTFDSLAGRLLLEAGEDVEQTSFDRRIVMATRLVESSRGDELELLRDLRHVMVDEAQDVVAARAGFVAALLQRLSARDDAGFTVFGDPAQAIYDFQFEGAGRDAQELRLLTPDLRLIPGDPVGKTLSTNYRMEPDRLAPLAEEFGDPLRTETGSGIDAWDELHREIGDECRWCDIEDAAGALRDLCEAPTAPSVAVLCRTNAEVLSLGARLQAAGLDVAVRHRAEDRAGAPWIATAFAGAKFGTAEVPESPADVEGHLAIPEDALKRFRRAGLAAKDEVDLRRLGALLRNRVCPEELAVTRESQVTVSTIHRAKGLEFDHVVVLDHWRRPEKEEAWDEARLLFVAATRPRDFLEGAPKLDSGGPVRRLNGTNRFAVCQWHKRNRPRRIEVRVSDSDPDWAPDSRTAFDSLQAYLRAEVKPGDVVRLVHARDEQDGCPVYTALHEGRDGQARAVGTTSRVFGEVIQKHVWGSTPKLIKGLTAEVPDCVAFDEGIAMALGIGTHGLHLRARFYGLGELCWE